MLIFEEKFKKWLEPSYFGVLLLAVSFITGFLPYAFSVALHGASPSQTGDWLINYGGGFVRRGFFGQFLLTVSPNSSFGLVLLVCVQGILYLSIFSFFAYVLLSRKSSWLITVLICSPAGICFYGWDMRAFGRKEVIGYLILVLLTVSIAIKHRRLLSRFLLVASLLIWIFGILSWEPIALLLPFVLVILGAHNPPCLSTFGARFIRLSFLLTGILGLIVSMIRKGNPEIALKICEVLRLNGFQGKDLCSGAIDAIGWTSQFTLNTVQKSFPLYFCFLPLFAFSIYPLVKSRILVGFERYALISFLSIFPLFIVVTDYGRWFTMYYTSLLITLIACGRTDFNLSSHVNSKFFSMIFLLSWGIPHWANEKSAFLFNGAIFTPIKVLAGSHSILKVSYGATLLVVFLLYLAMISRRFYGKEVLRTNGSE